MQSNNNTQCIESHIFINNGVSFWVAHNTNSKILPHPHLHPQHEIYFNLKGGEYYFVDKRFISVEPGDLLIIPRLQIHKSVRNLNAEYDAYVMNFDDTLFNTITNMPMLGDTECLYSPFIDLSKIGKDLPYKVHLSPSEQEMLSDTFEECRLGEQNGDSLTTLIKFIEILSFINKVFKDKVDDPNEIYASPRSSDKVSQYIEEHLCEDISASQIADDLFFNRTHLAEKFKEETGTTIHNYIIFRRLADAQKMLYEGASIKETALKCGFRNPSHFTKIFRQKLGFTPGFFKSTAHSVHYGLPKQRD